jgi:hypothetical protein
MYEGVHAVPSVQALSTGMLPTASAASPSGPAVLSASPPVAPLEVTPLEVPPSVRPFSPGLTCPPQAPGVSATSRIDTVVVSFMARSSYTVRGPNFEGIRPQGPQGQQ